MIAVLVIGGFTCSEIGRSVPLLKHIGGSVILATFVPSYLVAHHYLPYELVAPIQAFWKNDHPLYLFIATVLVGSVLSMDRLTLIQGFAKIFVPLVCGSIVAAFTGMLVGWMFGLDVFHTFFFIIVPIMAGGFGEGAIPLSIGYAKILEQPQGDVLAQILPVIMFANLCAITLSAVLHLLGRRFNHYSGDGRLQKNQNVGEHIEKNETSHLDSRQFLINIAVAGVTAITFYLIGVLAHQLFAWPAPIVMLVIAILMKLFNFVTPSMHQGAAGLHYFFTTTATYPLLFAIGVAVTPWDKLVAVFTVPLMATVFATVTSLMATGFMVGRRIGLFPIEAAIVTGCHSGMGGGGDVAILTASNRMMLMPFAQISTRIGGAATVIIALSVIYLFR
ncbi:putative malate Na(+) symporter [bacterium endosymbiont of Mortierella elongata FMR23-6]|nr:putative malate Na(+) symporter [bacterium endosymbiont of Mortierella elongata FMR23-6]